MKVEVDADELCELRRRAARSEASPARTSTYAISYIQFIEHENTRLKKELDEALAEMSRLMEKVDDAEYRSGVYYNSWCGAERRLSEMMRHGGAK